MTWKLEMRLGRVAHVEACGLSGLDGGAVEHAEGTVAGNGVGPAVEDHEGGLFEVGEVPGELQVAGVVELCHRLRTAGGRVYNSLCIR